MLREIELDTPEARPLLEGLEAEYAARYGENDELSAYDDEEFAPPGGVFFLVEENGLAIAGGGLRRLTKQTGEIKRMWTAEHVRRRGHASRVLAALERAAAARAYTRITLETGTEQPEAVRFYAAAGYHRIASYGRYRDDPRSICMAKDLGAELCGGPG